MHHLDDFGLDVNERGNLVCPPCDGVTARKAGPIHILALESIHRQQILLTVDEPLCHALRKALDAIAADIDQDQAPLPGCAPERARETGVPRLTR